MANLDITPEILARAAALVDADREKEERRRRRVESDPFTRTTIQIRKDYLDLLKKSAYKNRTSLKDALDLALESFANEAKAAGVDAVELPDIPEEHRRGRRKG